MVKSIVKDVKAKQNRQLVVRKLSITQQIQTTYLQLMSLIDDDIELRNQNTHDSFLSLGLYTGNDIYDPWDALLDVEGDAVDRVQRALRLEHALADREGLADVAGRDDGRAHIAASVAVRCRSLAFGDRLHWKLRPGPITWFGGSSLQAAWAKGQRSRGASRIVLHYLLGRVFQ